MFPITTKVYRSRLNSRICEHATGQQRPRAGCGRSAIDYDSVLGLSRRRMKRISAPEFRGKICTYLGFPFIRAGAGVLLLCLSVFVWEQSAGRLLAADPLRHFLRTSSTTCPPAFRLATLRGGEGGLPLETDRPVIIHFFATWCEPCRAEIATLEKFYEAREGKFDVLAVSVGEVPPRVRAFFKDTAVTFPVLLDADRAVTKTWSVQTLPTSIVLDAKLRPILTATGELDWASATVQSEVNDQLNTNLGSRSAECTKEHAK